MQTCNITDGGTGGVATIISNKDKIGRARPSDIRMAATHSKDKDFDAKLAYRKYINDLDLETIQMLERDKRAQENMENNLTRLRQTRIDRQNLGERKNLGERENISDVTTRIEITRSEPIFNIPTRIETTQSEPIFDIPTRIETIHEPNVTSDPDPPPSDSSNSSSSDSEKKRKKSKNKKKRRKNRKDDLSDPSSSDDSDDSDSSDDSHIAFFLESAKLFWMFRLE